MTQLMIVATVDQLPNRLYETSTPPNNDHGQLGPFDP